MSGKCQDEGCGKRVDELELEVKGRPGTGTGIRTCMNKMVPKTWVWKWTMVALGLALTFASAWMVLSSDVQAGKQDHAQNVKDIAEIKTDIQDIQAKMDVHGDTLLTIKVILEERVLKALEKQGIMTP